MALPRFFKSTLTSRANQYKQYGASTSKGTKYTKSGHASTYNVGGVMYIKEIDDDMDALRADYNFASRGSGSPGRDIEMQRPSYNVKVTGGRGRSETADLGGIQTTTVVTQRVDSL